MSKYSHKVVESAVKAARSVDRSQDAHHKALMDLMAHCARIETPLSLLSEYFTNRVTESKGSLCTEASRAWILKHFGIRITDDGEAKRAREFTAKGFTAATFEAGRQQPWYKLAKEMAFKVPSKITWTGAASAAAKLEATGEALPTMEQVYAEFLNAVKEYKKGQSFADWMSEYSKRAAA